MENKSTLESVVEYINASLVKGNLDPLKRHLNGPSSLKKDLRTHFMWNEDYDTVFSTTGVLRDRYRWTIRKPGVFKPVLRVELTYDKTFWLDVDPCPFKSKIYKAIRRPCSPARGWLFEELDAPLQALRKYIWAVMDQAEDLAAWHSVEGD